MARKNELSVELLELRSMLTAIAPEIIQVSAFAPIEIIDLPRSGAMTSADINQDGAADVIIADSALRILLGNGTGGFEQTAALPLQFTVSPPSRYELLKRPEAISLSVGDVNNDGLLDVIVGGYEDLAVVLSVGDGSGKWSGFQEPRPLEGSARKLELADLNQDGKLDLLSLTGDHAFHEDQPTGPGLDLVDFERRAEIRYGDGMGSFLLTAELTADALYVKEMTGDEMLDLLVRDQDVLRVFSFDDDGNLAPGSTHPVPSFANVDDHWPGEKDTSPTATEYFYDVGPRYFVNYDLYPDVFISDSYYDFGIGDVSTGTYVAFGTASGEFETPLRVADAFTDQWERFYPDLLPAPFLVDVDSNGLQDIIIADDFGEGAAVIRQIESSTYAKESLNYAFPDFPPVNQSLLVDLNQDGLLDVIANENVLCRREGSVPILFGQSNGGFGDPTTLTIGHGGELRWIEHDGQSFVDISGFAEKTTIRYATDLDRFEVRAVEGANYYSAYANTNNDGLVDFFTIEYDPNSRTERLVLHESRPDGSSSYEILLDPLPERLVLDDNRAVDLDGDGVDEFLFRYRGPERMWVASRLNGEWNLEDTRKTFAQLVGAAADDSDSNETKLDFAADYSPTNATIKFTETVAAATGGTTRQDVELRFPALHSETVVQFANNGLRFNHQQAERDVDNDGDLDLVVSHGSGVAVLLAIGNGDFDQDGSPTHADLELLRIAIANGQSDSEWQDFDLNSDAVLDSADEEIWIAEVAQIKRGDIDLDGDVDFSDFLILSQNFGKSTNVWSRGDLDGNGEVDDIDFKLLADQFGFRRTPG